MNKQVTARFLKGLAVFVLIGVSASFSFAQLRYQALPGLTQAEAPKDSVVSPWKWGGLNTLGFNLTNLTNWAAGGQNAISLSAITQYYLDYSKGKMNWESALDFGFGLQKNEDAPFRKTEDRIEFNSKVGYAFSKNFSASGQLNLRTQFAPGYNLPNDSVVTSRFFAPAFSLLALGLDFRPVSQFSVLIAPVTGKLTFVTDQTLADQGAFGVEAAVLDADGTILTPGRNVRAEFGASLSFRYRQKWDWLSIISRLDLFNNYTAPDPSNRKNVDVNFETTVAFHVKKFLTVNFQIAAIYDDDVMVPLFEEINGVRTQVGAGPRLQLKQLLTVGFALRFGAIEELKKK
jgi:hypothetical protein